MVRTPRHKNKHKHKNIKTLHSSYTFAFAFVVTAFLTNAFQNLLYSFACACSACVDNEVYQRS